jgi:two-component system NtrC family response regulator
MAEILIIEPSEEYGGKLAVALQALGHSSTCVQSMSQALKTLTAAPSDLVVVSAQMPDGNALELLPTIRQGPNSPQVIVLSDSLSADEAEAAVKGGAWEYVLKPSSPKDLSALIHHAAGYVHQDKAVWSQNELGDVHFEGIIGSSPSLRACLDIVAHAANSNANVLIKGETGTGKELVAWGIHRNSPRAAGNFVVVDCASLPETLVESMLLGHEKGAFTGADKARIGLVKQADGGTLFLDEIGELPLSTQKAFLRVLDERRFRPVGGKEEIHSDFRLISASNRNLEELVQKSAFREDLLFRIRSFAIEVPPLRQRLEDIKPIVMYHMPRICERLGIGIKEISPEFGDALNLYSWPGNVRELVNSLERSLVAARTERILLPQHLPTYLRVMLARSSAESAERVSNPVDWKASTDVASLPSLQTARDAAVNQAEQEYLEKLMELSDGNIESASRISKLSRSRLYSLLKKHQIHSSR